ncbi:MAG: phytanoyl-CoA dioxygenase family protein [Acidimicrobiales bacterium]|nr:phytanoyl-CoA dioxygenase family protein [Acidimicrobiales bacterium]
MLTRAGYLFLRDDGPEASHQLEREGYAVLRAVFTGAEIARLRREIEAVFATERPPVRVRGRTAADYADFRHGMLNKSAAAQEAAGHRGILDVIEPLLGEDCHVIANTSWRNQPHDPRAVDGGAWHCDAGPHVPRAPGVPWDDRIPYPVFAIGVHILLQDCPLACGPTGVLAGSHRSGQAPPLRPVSRLGVLYENRGPVPLTGEAGDVAMFVSDTWHRRLPPIPSGDTGRFFLQVHYGRRDLAQRIELTEHVNHLRYAAVRRAKTDRERRLVGLHPPGFYDA